MDTPIRTWAPGPPTVRAAAGAIDVWRADLAAIGDPVEQLLSDEERARAARIVPPRKRVLWARSRGVLRALLGHYLDRDPRSLNFVLGPLGKPSLAQEGPGQAATDLHFNISHSGHLALVAVSTGHEVGVDIERARARYTAEFLHDWVAREAIFKCRGNDSTADPWTTQLEIGPDFAAAVAVEGGRCELRRWDWRA